MDGPKNIERDAMPRVVAWLVGAWVVALGLFVASADGAYPTTDAGKAAYFGPLRTFVQNLGPEFVLWASGDSWTCNAQSPGETHGWGSDVFGGGTASSHNAIWADPTTSNGTTWLARLGWRLKTHKFGAEAIGGAQITTNNDIPATFDEDVTIAAWVDDAAAFKPDVWLFYGGINDILGDNGNYSSMKAKYLLVLDEAKKSMPANSRWVFLTLQPCAIDYLGMKVSSPQAPWDGYTYRRTLDSCYVKQLIVDQVNTWLKDSLRIAAKAHNSSIDTTRLFTYDHVAKLQASWATWLSTRAPSAYVLNLGGVTSEAGAPSAADSLKWSALRVLRQEIESDSIHCNQRGLRQIGDSMAVEAFGINLSTWTAGTHKTLYVDKQNGHNWTNRGRETNRTTPLASLQCAVWRAWPGDTIQVIGTGNQALLATADAGSPATVSATPYEVTINKPGLYIRAESGAYFQGILDSNAEIHGTAAKTVGSGFFHNTDWSGGDGYELTTTFGRSKAWRDTTATGNARIEMQNMTLDGVKISGYGSTPVWLPNVDDIRFVDCEFIGGASSSLGAVQYYGYPYSDTTPDSLDVYLEGCTFYADSSAVETANTQPWGMLYFATPGATPGLNDSLSFDGKILNCQFIGDAYNSAGPAVKGEWDGIDFVGCTFTDPAAYNYTVLNTRTGASSKRYNAKTHFVNNTFYIGRTSASPDTVTTCVRYDNVSQSTPRADSLIFINNWVKRNGGNYSNIRLYSGGLNNSKFWFARNLVPSWSRPVADGNGAVRSLGYLAGYNIGGAGNYSPACAPDTTTNIRSRNWAGRFSASSDSMKMGGVLSTTRGAYVWKPAQYGVEVGPYHTSVGSTIYAGEPYVWTATLTTSHGVNRIGGPWKLLQLINNGVLPAADSLDYTTWHEIPRVYNDSDKVLVRSWLDAWENWPNTARMKVRFAFASSPMKVISPSDSSYANGPWGALKHIVSGGGTVSDSTSASTWYQFPRPYNHTDELQLDYWSRVWKKWPDATRKKIRYRVQGTDLAMFEPDGTSLDGLWAVDAAITAATATASDSLDEATWFLLPRVRDKEFAQAVQSRIYLDALATWPDAKRKRVRVRTK